MLSGQNGVCSILQALIDLCHSKGQPFQGVFPLWALSTRSVDT